MFISICLPIMLLAISIGDIRNRVISNRSVLIVISIAIIAYIYSDINFYFSSFLIATIAGFVLWMLRVIGAGDVKLSSALSLMIEPNYLFLSVFVMTAVGGILAVIEVCLSKLIFKREQKPIPYGVAISLGFGVGILASI